MVKNELLEPFELGSLLMLSWNAVSSTLSATASLAEVRILAKTADPELRISEFTLLLDQSCNDDGKFVWNVIVRQVQYSERNVGFHACIELFES